MEIITNLMLQTPPILSQLIFVLGIYVLTQIMYNCGSVIYNILLASCSAISITCCATISAKQKSIANNTKYNASTETILIFLWKNFILHLSADGEVEYDSPDFRWKSIFDYDTYNIHVCKNINQNNKV